MCYYVNSLTETGLGVDSLPEDRGLGRFAYRNRGLVFCLFVCCLFAVWRFESDNELSDTRLILYLARGLIKAGVMGCESGSYGV